MYGRKMNVCLADGTAMPTYTHDGDAGFDLCIAEDVRLEPNASAVYAPLVNLSCDTVFLPKGTRVCQMVVVPFVPCDLVGVDSLTDTERGTDGFGSTGVD